MDPAEVSLPAHASSVAAARRFAEATLDRWGRSEAAWTVALLVSELASNCVLHARTPFAVRLSTAGDATLRLEVRDSSARLLQPRRYGVDATTGRGLRLIDELAHGWGVVQHKGGKTVWVDLRASPVHTGEPAPDTDVEAVLAAFPDEPDVTGTIGTLPAPADRAAEEPRGLAA